MLIYMVDLGHEPSEPNKTKDPYYGECTPATLG